MADAEAAFLKTFFASVDKKKTLGEILRDLLEGEDLIDYSKLDHPTAQAVKGLLGVRIEQVQLDKTKKKPASRRRGGTRGGTTPPANEPGSEAAAE